MLTSFHIKNIKNLAYGLFLGIIVWFVEAAYLQQQIPVSVTRIEGLELIAYVTIGIMLGFYLFGAFQFEEIECGVVGGAVLSIVLLLFAAQRLAPIATGTIILVTACTFGGTMLFVDVSPSDQPRVSLRKFATTQTWWILYFYLLLAYMLPNLGFISLQSTFSETFTRPDFEKAFAWGAIFVAIGFVVRFIVSDQRTKITLWR